MEKCEKWNHRFVCVFLKCQFVAFRSQITYCYEQPKHLQLSGKGELVSLMHSFKDSSVEMLLIYNYFWQDQPNYKLNVQLLWKDKSVIEFGYVN